MCAPPSVQKHREEPEDSIGSMKGGACCEDFDNFLHRREHHEQRTQVWHVIGGLPSFPGHLFLSALTKA